MIKVENIVTPNTAWWDVAINGMRNSYKSNDKHDSSYCYGSFAFPDNKSDLCKKCPFYKINCYEDECTYYENEGYPTYVLGENDLKLFLNLCKAGTSHRKVLRQLPVIMDITAPEYFFRQLDTYKIGTTSNSTSQMHTLLKEPFKYSDFSLDDNSDWDCIGFGDNFAEIVDKKNPFYFNNYKEKFYIDDLETESFVDETGKTDVIAYTSPYDIIGGYIDYLNFLRELYLKAFDDRKEFFWRKILQLIPQSFNYTRTWTANYEVLLNIVQQRKGHKLQEWADFTDLLLEHVPYLKEIVEAINE